MLRISGGSENRRFGPATATATACGDDCGWLDMDLEATDVFDSRMIDTNGRVV